MDTRDPRDYPVPTKAEQTALFKPPPIVASTENVHELKELLRNLGKDFDKLHGIAQVGPGVLYIEFATYRRMIPKGHDDVFKVMRELADAIHTYEDRPAPAHEVMAVLAGWSF